jgi:hypothetical protein
MLTGFLIRLNTELLDSSKHLLTRPQLTITVQDSNFYRIKNQKAEEDSAKELITKENIREKGFKELLSSELIYVDNFTTNLFVKKSI